VLTPERLSTPGLRSLRSLRPGLAYRDLSGRPELTNGSKNPGSDTYFQFQPFVPHFQCSLLNRCRSRACGRFAPFDPGWHIAALQADRSWQTQTPQVRNWSIQPAARRDPKFRNRSDSRIDCWHGGFRNPNERPTENSGEASSPRIARWRRSLRDANDRPTPNSDGISSSGPERPTHASPGRSELRERRPGYSIRQGTSAESARHDESDRRPRFA